MTIHIAKSRASARSKIGGGAFAASLQSQWADDRKKKGEYKRARAEARVAAEDAAPWLSKKSARPPPATAGVSSSDVSIINTKIRHFLMHELGQSSISLPPMSKRSRVAVHLLAEVYNLKSKSMGSGKSRFPLLQRGPNSGVFGVDERRVRAIIGTTAGDPSYPNSSSFGGGRKAVGKMGGLWAALTGDTKKNGGRGSGGGGGGGDSSRKNREGAVVGQGADRLGEGNVGYELLKRMGCVLHPLPSHPSVLLIDLALLFLSIDGLLALRLVSLVVSPSLSQLESKPYAVKSINFSV